MNNAKIDSKHYSEYLSHESHTEIRFYSLKIQIEKTE